MRTLRHLPLRRALVAGCAGLACAAISLTARGADEAEEPPEATKPARPPLPPEPPRVKLPFDRHVELGLGAALVARPASDPSGIRYMPALGVDVHARWDVFRWLRFNVYFVSAVHGLRAPFGALGPAGDVTGEEGGTAPTVDTLAFGARLAPTLPLSERARSWIGVGIGYGRFSFDRMTIREPGLDPYEVRERGLSFAEVPLSLGASYDVIRDWLTIEVEVSAAVAVGQDGTATIDAQAIRAGSRQNIGPLPKIDASVAQTIGLSIIL